jgi:hypothetical protein
LVFGTSGDNIFFLCNNWHALRQHNFESFTFAKNRHLSSAKCLAAMFTRIQCAHLSPNKCFLVSCRRRLRRLVSMFSYLFTESRSLFIAGRLSHCRCHRSRAPSSCSVQTKKHRFADASFSSATRLRKSALLTVRRGRVAPCCSYRRRCRRRRCRHHRCGCCSGPRRRPVDLVFLLARMLARTALLFPSLWYALWFTLLFSLLLPAVGFSCCRCCSFFFLQRRLAVFELDLCRRPLL